MIITSLGEALSAPHKASKQLIGSGILLEQTKLVLYGNFKAGKSTLVTYLAMCLAGGIPLFGDDNFRTIRSKVLYVQLEMPEIPFTDRLRHSILSKDEHVRENLWISTVFWLKLDTSEGLEVLDTALDKIHPDVLIIDPLYKCTLGGEEYKDLSRVYDQLDLRIMQHHFALIFTAQGRKTLVLPHGTIDLGDQELRGSTATGGWVDSIIGLRRREDTERKLTGTLRHGFTPTFDVVIDYDRDKGTYINRH